MDIYTVYILYSPGFDLYYKGMTNKLKKRIFQHNNNLSRYTKNKGPWKLVWTAEYPTKREALIEEARIKKLNRRSLEKLIASRDKGSSAS